MDLELYSAQFEDSACTLVEVKYDVDLEHRIGKANISRVFSSICLNFPSVSSAESNTSLYFSLKPSKKLGPEAWQEIQSFRLPFGIINLTSGSDKMEEILPSTEGDVAVKSLPQMSLHLVAEKINEQCDGHQVDLAETDENENLDIDSRHRICSISLDNLEFLHQSEMETFFIRVLECVLQRKKVLERCLQPQQNQVGNEWDLIRSVMPLTIEKEEKQLLGVNVQNIKERTTGRCLKLLGDLCLLLTKFKIAAENFKKAAESLMIAKDWTWYAAALEGSITSAYLMNLPTNHSAPCNFYERLLSHQNEILCIEDRLPITERMKQAFLLEKTIINYYDKSGESKSLLYDFKFKVSLARYSFGIFKSKLDGQIIDDSFKLFPELRSKSSPKKQPLIKHSPSNTSSDAAASEVRRCLAAVKLFVFKEQTRKAAWLLREIIGGDISCGYFRNNPKAAILYLIQILPVYEISITDAFRHRATRRGRLAWKELQQHLIDLILYYTELLQQDKFYSAVASNLNIWFKCFMLNTFYHLLPGAEISNLISALSSFRHLLDCSSNALTLDSLTFPTVSFTNIPFLRSIEILYPYKRQLHLKEKSQIDSLNNSSVFEFQTAFVGNMLASKPYIWPSSSSIIVQLMFSNSLRCEQNMSVNVELVLSGVEVAVETRTVRIPSMSVESVNFEVTLIEPGEFTVCGYKLKWIEMDYSSDVMFNHKSKFITKHLFGIPYLECYWFPSETVGAFVTAKEKTFITKDYTLTKALFFGSSNTAKVYVDALADIENLEINLVSRSSKMFSVDYEKRPLSKGETLPVTFQLSSAEVNLTLEDELLQMTSSQSFVKIVIDGLVIPFFTLSMEVFPSVVIEEVTLLPACKPQFFNIGIQFRNYMGVDIVVKAGDESSFTIMANSVERNLFLLPKVTAKELKCLQNDEGNDSSEKKYFDILCLFQRFKVTWFDEKNGNSGSAYLSPEVVNEIEPKFVHDLCVDNFLYINITVQGGGEIEDKNSITCKMGEITRLLADIRLDSELNINLASDTCLKVRTSANCFFSDESINIESDDECFRPNQNPVILGCNVRFPFMHRENCNEIGAFQESIDLLPVFPGIFYFQIVLGATLFSHIWKINIQSIPIDE